MTANLDRIRKNLQKERPFDTLIIFGEGPVKPILIPEELSEEQILRWRQYRANPIKFREPNFYVLDDPKILRRIKKLTPDGKDKLRAKFQENSRFSLKRWGRQNALAAGLALYAGLTKKVLLSGGKTKPKWLELSEPERELWPSEANLMKDTIVRNFAKIYFEKYKKPIENLLVLEEEATNTLENFAYSINKMPQIISKGHKVGLLTAHHHQKRVAVLAKLFSLNINEGGILSAQELLKAGKLYSQYEKDVLQIVENIAQCGDIKDLNYFEERWIRGLKDPKYLTYWFGYVAEVRNPRVLDAAFGKFKDPSWNKAAAEAFSILKIAIDDYTKESISNLQKSSPEKYDSLMQKLQLLKRPEYRKLPPPLILPSQRQ